MTNYIQTKLVCPECGNVFPIMRKESVQRRMFHRKRLYCVNCRKVTNHIELKDFDKWLGGARLRGEENLNQEEKEVFQLIKKRSE